MTNPVFTRPTVCSSILLDPYYPLIYHCISVYYNWMNKKIENELYLPDFSILKRGREIRVMNSTSYLLGIHPFRRENNENFCLPGKPMASLFVKKENL